MSSLRQNKVARLIQKEIGEIFQKDELMLFSSTMVSVTVVRVSPDLSFAKVYISVFGKSEPNEVLDSIKNNLGQIRKILGNKVRNQLRKVPELAFYNDDSIDYAEEIESLLKK